MHIIIATGGCLRAVLVPLPGDQEHRASHFQAEPCAAGAMDFLRISIVMATFSTENSTNTATISIEMPSALKNSQILY